MAKRQEDVEKLILDTASKLFEQKGYNNVRISDITKEIGMTTGFFYYHFQSKEQVLQLIYESYISKVAHDVKYIFKQNESTIKKLELLIKRHTRGIYENHSQVSVFFREYRNLPEESIRIIQEKNSEITAIYQGIIEQGVAEGVFREDLNPKMVSLAIIGMCNWTYQWYKEGRGLSIEEIGDLFFKLVSSGLEK